MYNHVFFSITQGKPDLHSIEQYECRGDNAFRILSQLVERKPELFEGKKCLATFSDYPPEEDELVKSADLVFCSTKTRGQTAQFLEMPCPYSIGWPQVGIPDGEAMAAELLTISTAPRSPKMFWIGAETHPSRRWLCDLSIHYPDVLEAELMGWEGQEGKTELRSRARYATLQEHADYKYLVDCAGVGYSGRLRWLLATGRPVFIVERPFVEHWHEMMVPWEHYVPVKEDLSDLIQAYQELEMRPWLYDKISTGARAFVQEHLFLDRHLDRMLAQVEAFLESR